MPLLQWKPEYALGIASVDQEHREMIDLINEACEQVDNPSDGDAMEQVLGDIHAAISAHFALEERLMRRAKYPEFQDHKGDHEELLDQIRDLMDQVADDPVAGREQLRRQLSDWFGRHFASFDARLHEQLPH